MHARCKYFLKRLARVYVWVWQSTDIDWNECMKLSQGLSNISFFASKPQFMHEAVPFMCISHRSLLPHVHNVILFFVVRLLKRTPEPIMQAPRPKPKESKFVSIFSDSKPDSDISFRDAAEGLLRQSADRYVVGVDNLTVNMDGFSMIDQTVEPEILLEVMLLKHTGAPDDPVNPATWLQFPSEFRYTDERTYQLRNDNTNITTFADIIQRLNEIAAKVTEDLDLDTHLGAGNDAQFSEVGSSAGTAEHHLRFSLDVTGRLTVRGSRLFWATHLVHIPLKKYQRIFLGTSWRRHVDQRIISLSPYDTGFGGLLGVYTGTSAEFGNLGANGYALITDKILVIDEILGVTRAYMRRWSEIDAAKFAANPANQITYTWLQYILGPSANAQEWAVYKAAFKFQGNLFSTLDRRVCIEVGTSLPIKNSPLVEDNIEASDFILGRFFINPALRIKCDEHGDFREIIHHGPSVYTLMDGKQRVLYHQLGAQQKITTVRIKLYARVRTYDEAADTWSMRVISLPTELTDWWHIRLHFKEIDSPLK